MKNVINVDSNSKSEDTSLDEQTETLVGLLNDMFFECDDKLPPAHLLAKYAAKILLLNKSEQANLLQVIEDEVSMNQKGQFEDDAGNICWYLDDLLQILKQIKERL